MADGAGKEAGEVQKALVQVRTRHSDLCAEQEKIRDMKLGYVEKLKAAETKAKNAKRGASSEELKAAMAAAAKKANESAEARQKKMEARLAKKDAALKEQRRKAAMMSG